MESGFATCTDGQIEKYAGTCVHRHLHTQAHVSWLCTLRAWELCHSNNEIHKTKQKNNSEIPSIQVLVSKHHSHQKEGGTKHVHKGVQRAGVSV